MNRRVLLLNPGYNEFGDYGYYHQAPMGLLKIGRYLKGKGVDVKLLDCSIPSRLSDSGGNLKDFYTDAPFIRMVRCGNYTNEGCSKAQKYYGMPHRLIKQAIVDYNPTEIWLGSGLTYYWETVKDCAHIAKEACPHTPLLLGGIYPTLYPKHASNNISADYIHVGPLDDIDDLFPDYSLYEDHIDTARTIQLGKGCNVSPPCSFCFLPGTPILTDNGWKTIEALKLSDMCCTSGGVYEPITHLLSREYKGKIVSIRGNGIYGMDLHVTEDHKIPTLNRGTINAIDLRLDDQIEIPLPDRTLKGLDPHYARLLGYYCSEGSVGKCRKKEPQSVVFTFNKNESQYITDVSYLSKDLFNKDCWISDTGTATQIAFSSKIIAKDIVAKCGHGASKKKIPSEVMRSTDFNFVKEFLRGLYRGDGSIFLTSKNLYRISYTTISLDLAWGLMSLLRSMNYWTCIQKYKTTSNIIQGRACNVSEYRYQVTMNAQDDVYCFASDILGINLDPVKFNNITNSEAAYIQSCYPMMKKTFKGRLLKAMGWGKSHWFNVRTKTTKVYGLGCGLKYMVLDKVEPYDYEGMVYNCTVVPTHKVTTTIGLVNQCAVVAMDPKFKSLSAQSTFDFIKHEYEVNKVNYFRLWSSQLLVPKSRFVSLMKKIVDSGIHISMVASEGVQPSLFDQEVSDLMKAAGFIAVSIPMESIEESTVKDFRKPSDFSDYEKAVRCAQQSGFGLIKSFVMIGCPGQSMDEMVHAIVDCWARDVSPALHQYTPIPGSYDWERYTQFHDKSPEELHPSLWPAATNSMKVEDLEEVKKIAKIGPHRLYYTYKNSQPSHIWDLFFKWCREYGLIEHDGKPTFDRPLALSGYYSNWTKYCLEHKCQLLNHK